MCGRFLLETDDDNVELYSIIETIEKGYQGEVFSSSGEVFPGSRIPVLSRFSGNVEGMRLVSTPPCLPGSVVFPGLNTNTQSYAAHIMHWGFLLPGQSRRPLIINARSETMTEKPMFRRLVETNRCIIPASGFFEWATAEGSMTAPALLPVDQQLVLSSPITPPPVSSPQASMPQAYTHRASTPQDTPSLTVSSPSKTSKKKKVKYLIRPASISNSKRCSFFYLAGLTNRLLFPNGEQINCTVIITTYPSAQMSEIHNRMPVILDFSMAEFWLSAAPISQMYDSGILSPWSGALEISLLR
ncbi:MAG: SOS response-associated peptidase [Oscillospiraceae bacterium]|nr:SOS response-associated peptidase [Oscillospiraceae bacterium]